MLLFVLFLLRFKFLLLFKLLFLILEFWLFLLFDDWFEIFCSFVFDNGLFVICSEFDISLILLLLLLFILSLINTGLSFFIGEINLIPSLW